MSKNSSLLSQAIDYQTFVSETIDEVTDAFAMIATMDPKVRTLVHKMLNGLAGGPLVPRDVANAAFAIMCLALSKMTDAKQRDQLLAELDAATRDRVASLMREEEAGDGPTWLQ